MLAALSYAAVSQTVLPDGITLASDTYTFSAGQSYNVTSQILLGGGPLRSEAVRVYFTSTNDTVMPIDYGTYVLTDSNGMASLTVTAKSAGNANLTAMAMSLSGPAASKKFNVVETPATTPTPTPTVTPEPSPSATPEQTANQTPTESPTMAPIFVTVSPGTPTATDPGAQARGIIALGIVIAAILLIVVSVAKTLWKK